MAARPKITPCCQGLPQHRSFSCLYAQLSPGPDPRSSLAGDRDGRAKVGAQPLWQLTPCSPLLPHLQEEGTPAGAAKQKENNNSNCHGNRAECLLYTSEAEATASML